MKKIALFVCALILAVAAAIAVNADGAKVTVELTGSEVVNTGKTVDYVLTAKGITLSDGILGLDLTVNYDTSVFELADVTTVQPSGWSTEINKKTAGTIKLTALELSANKDNAVKKDGSLKFTVSLKVKSGADKTSEISVSGLECTGTDLEAYSGTANKLTVKIQKALSAPSPISFESGVAKWSAVTNADSYSVQIYKDGKESGNPVSVKGTEYDFSKKLTDGGSYCFTVVAISDKPEYADSDESAKSASYTVKGKLTAPKIVLSPDYDNGGLKYQITDTNPDGSVAQYIIEIYSGSKKLSDYEAAGKAGNLPCDTHIKAGTSYTAKVSAIAKNDKQYSDSAASAASSSAKAAAKIKNIAIKTLPKLSYVDGEKLDLSALVVTVNYDGGSSEDVKFADFEAFGLETSIANGKKLAIADTGKTIVVSFADKFTATTTALTVTTNECTHEKTHVEQKTATCGEDGYERTVCDKCNAVITEKILPATGEHQYGDWVIKAEPTSELKGVKERICSVCGHKQTEEIPATGSDSSSDSGSGTTSGNGSESGTTNPPSTDPASTSGSGKPGTGKITDLGRIFLIIIIVIFAIIVLCLVGSVYLESRRNKARRARYSNNSRGRGNPNGRGGNGQYRR